MPAQEAWDLLRASRPSLEHICARIIEQKALTEQLVSGVPAVKASPESSKKSAPGMSPQTEVPAQAESDSNSSTSDSSDKSSELEDSDWEAEFGSMEGCQWFLQDGHGRPALLHLVESTLATELVPYCRKTPFVNQPIESGFGMRSASIVPSQPCPRCLKVMPVDLAKYVLHWLVD